MLHVRDMVPPVREQIEEHVSELIEVATEDVYERDPKTGVLIRVGATPGGYQVVTRSTGEMVDDFATTEDGQTWTQHEGSLKQVDLHCGDCGALLKPGNDRDFYYLLCSRLDEREHDVFKRFVERAVPQGEGSTRLMTVLESWRVEGDKPRENCVLECGREGLD